MTEETSVTERVIGAWRVFFSAPGDRAALDELRARMVAAGDTNADRVRPAGGTLVHAGQPVDPSSCVWTFKTLTPAAAERLRAAEEAERNRCGSR